MTDNINHPKHYEAYRVSFEPADLTARLPHPLASAIEYILRAGRKDASTELEDMQKAVWWLSYLLDSEDFWKPTADGKRKYLVMPEIDDRIRVAAHTALALKAPMLQRLFVCGTSIVMREDVVALLCQIKKQIEEMPEIETEKGAPSHDTALQEGEP